MFQSIATKYLGPTNTKGGRIKATCSAGSVTHPRDYALNISDDHARVAAILADRMGWAGDWHGGATERGYVFVLATKPTFVIT